jgi:hypothetical protein
VATRAAVSSNGSQIVNYWPGTQKFLNPRTGRAPLSRVLIGGWTNGLLMSQPEVERAPFWCIVPFYGCMWPRRRRAAARVADRGPPRELKIGSYFSQPASRIRILAQIMDEMIERGQNMATVFIDYVAAFDSVSHKFIDDALCRAKASRKSRAMFRAI